jgi:SPP1 family predicted phage head-tail adaptor
MRAGILRNYITIQQPTETHDGNLELVLTWSTFTQCWAEILPLNGREYWTAKQVLPEITGKIRIRYITGITPKMRILFGTRYFNINAVLNPDERNIELILLVTEVV